MPVAVREESYRTYPIPGNFVDDSRIVRGMFRTKNFIEAVILAAAALIPAMLVPADDIAGRITAVILLCGPFFVLGVIGIGGDTFFSFVRQMRSWQSSKSLLLYNSTPQALYKTPLQAMMESETARDRVVGMYERFREGQESRGRRTLIEGVDFEFREDPMLKRLRIPDETGKRDPDPDGEGTQDGDAGAEAASFFTLEEVDPDAL